MPRNVVILDDTPASQKLGMTMLGSIGRIVTSVQFTTVDELSPVADPHAVYCPLTLNLPPTFQFWGQSIFQACQDIDRLRDLAVTTTGIKVGDGGNLWLPIIWTARDPIYGELIGEIDGNQDLQTIHLEDVERQPLDRFGCQLLTQLNAPPATYLVQFSKAQEIGFDRLFPFPALPTLASIGVQHPDLFEYHWRCIMGQSTVNVQTK